MKTRLTKNQVIDHLNKKANWRNSAIAFRASGSDYGIEIYLGVNVFFDEMPISASCLNSTFYAQLERDLSDIDIEQKPKWNNSGTTFSCWIDGNTCAWTKE